MISKIYTSDWFGRTESDYIYNPSDKMKGIVQIPNNKYSSFLYNEDKAERICSDINLLKKEMENMTQAIGLSNINVKFSEDNETACTNGSFIEIGIGKDYKDISDCYEKLDRIIGLTIHESCHCLYTDFNYFRKILPKYPSIVFHIHNIIEDELIEQKLNAQYPGYHNFLNKLKYNIFTNNNEPEQPLNKDIDDILNILFFLIRYPKFISNVNDDILGKYENIFAQIKKIMKDNGCFDRNNSNVTKSSINAAIEIYELIKDLISVIETPMNSNNSGENSSNNNSKNNSEDKSEDDKTGDNSEKNDNIINVQVRDENDPIFKDFDEISNGNGGGIIGVLTKIYKECSSESEQVNIKELIVYHTEIEKSINEDNDFTWNKIQEQSLNINIHISKIENRENYNKYKNEVNNYINEIKKLIINNSSKEVIINSKYHRNGSLDPTRLANAMCNEQTVYVRKESKKINNEPEYALGIILDESGSMTDHGINLLASKIAIMFYEAIKDYSKIKLFIYGHGDTVYKYIDPKNCKNKYVLGNRRQQSSQDELESYKLIVDDIKSQTKLPIVIFNITDSCYCSNERKLADLVEELNNDKKQKTFINLICLGHNTEVSRSVKNWNDLIYGKGNWVIYNEHKLTSSWNNIINDMSKIIHRNVKLK